MLVVPVVPDVPGLLCLDRASACDPCVMQTVGFSKEELRHMHRGALLQLFRPLEGGVGWARRRGPAASPRHPHCPPLLHGSLEPAAPFPSPFPAGGTYFVAPPCLPLRHAAAAAALAVVAPPSHQAVPVTSPLPPRGPAYVELESKSGEIVAVQNTLALLPSFSLPFHCVCVCLCVCACACGCVCVCVRSSVRFFCR